MPQDVSELGTRGELPSGGRDLAPECRQDLRRGTGSRRGIAGERRAAARRHREHTGRSPKDKFIVEEPTTIDDVWWGAANQPFEPAKFDALLEKAKAYIADKDVLVFDGYAGADPEYRLPLRVVTEKAWHSLFAHNMFLRETDPLQARELRAAGARDRSVRDGGRFRRSTARAARRSFWSTSPRGWC